jgi:hypothetical protein
MCRMHSDSTYVRDTFLRAGLRVRRCLQDLGISTRKTMRPAEDLEPIANLVIAYGCGGYFFNHLCRKADVLI